MRPEACVAAQLALAEKNGAALRRNETVQDVQSSRDGVTIVTDHGSYRADKVIVAAGAWLPKLVGGPFETLLQVYRQTLHWFEIEGDASRYKPEHFPVFIWELSDWPQGIYGFPMIDGAGIKIATEYYEQTILPDAVARSVSPEEVAVVRDRLALPNFKGLSGRNTKSAVCLYTVTPDAGFIIDHLPQSDRVIAASCCSGHGFKHSAALGEVLADMVQNRRPALDIAPFRLARFGV